ncbi:phage tail protein [Campylobacter sp. RM12640]|uniref:phage tail protein n=1 Tax=unclassified Campylobacter TaxID=2593542 RepID=UPI003014E2F0|nr:phage tail protein [Campylobacter sp. RM12640]MBZ7989938.1 phage tail protein [Campylobacter sp. RM12635]
MVFALGDFTFNERHNESVTKTTDYALGFNDRINNYPAFFKNVKTKVDLEIKGHTIPRVDGLKTLDLLKQIAESNEPQSLTNSLGEYFGLFVVVDIVEETANYLPSGAFLSQNFTIKLKKVGE